MKGHAQPGLDQASQRCFALFDSTLKRIPSSYYSPNYWQGFVLGARRISCLYPFKKLYLNQFRVKSDFVVVIPVVISGEENLCDFKIQYKGVTD